MTPKLKARNALLSSVSAIIQNNNDDFNAFANSYLRSLSVPPSNEIVGYLACGYALRYHPLDFIASITTSLEVKEVKGPLQWGGPS